MAKYERHEPEKTLLHQIVREQLEGFLASATLEEQPSPRFIEQELRAFLRCGVLARMLLCLNLPPRAPPLRPAPAEAASLDTTQDAWLFDQSPTYEEP